MAKKQQIKYVAYVASSIDGRIAKSGSSGTDWTSKEDWDYFQNALKSMDAVIVGHNTYKVARDRLQWRNTVVLTSKVSKPKTEGKVTFFNPEKSGNSELKKFLQNQNYKKVAILGGGKVYDYCLRHQMIDEFYVTIEPLVFTEGTPMFSGKDFKKFKFTLQSVKKLNKKGTLLLKYKYQNK